MLYAQVKISTLQDCTLCRCVGSLLLSFFFAMLLAAYMVEEEYHKYLKVRLAKYKEQRKLEELFSLLLN